MKRLIVGLIALSLLGAACKTRQFHDNESTTESWNDGEYKWKPGQLITQSQRKTFFFHWTQPDPAAKTDPTKDKLKHPVDTMKYLISLFQQWLAKPAKEREVTQNGMAGEGLYGALDPYTTYNTYGTIGYVIPVKPMSKAIVDNLDGTDYVGTPSRQKMMEDPKNKIIAYAYGSMAKNKKKKKNVRYAVVIRDESVVDWGEFNWNKSLVIDGSNGAASFRDVKAVYFDASKHWLEILKKNEKNLSVMQSMTASAYFSQDGKDLNPAQIGGYAVIGAALLDKGANISTLFKSGAKTKDGKSCDANCVVGFLTELQNSSPSLEYMVPTQKMHDVQSLVELAAALGAIPEGQKYDNKPGLMVNVAKYIVSKDSAKYSKFMELGNAVAKIYSGYNKDGLPSWHTTN